MMSHVTAVPRTWFKMSSPGIKIGSVDSASRDGLRSNREDGNAREERYVAHATYRSLFVKQHETQSVGCNGRAGHARKSRMTM